MRSLKKVSLWYSQFVSIIHCASVRSLLLNYLSAPVQGLWGGPGNGNKVTFLSHVITFMNECTQGLRNHL